MSTVFVNPSKPRKRRKKRKAAPRRKATMATRRRTPRKRVTRRRRRRNAGITSFVEPRRANPLILQNPRRRKRRNPQFNLNTAFKKVLTYSGGSAVGAGINILAIRRIDNMWMRNGARVVAAVLGGNFLKGEMGAAMAGATLYPLFAELALQFNLVDAGEPVEADLEEMAADLEAALDDIDLDENFAQNELYDP